MAVGKRTSWMNIQYGGTANPGAVSEEIPIVVDASTVGGASTTTYSFTTTVSVPEENWTSGAQAVLTFYNDANEEVGSTDYGLTGAMTAGTEYTITRGPMAAPNGTTYALARVEANGAPSESNPLQVFDARVLNTNNNAMPAVLNQTASFSAGVGSWSPENGAFVSAVYSPLTAADGVENSLVIASTIELLGTPNCAAGGAQSTINELIDEATGEGACFRISAPGGSITPGLNTQGYYDFGTPQPTQDIVESMLLDGERPFGRRSSNRTLQIPVMIFARSIKAMSAARDYLLNQIDQDTFQIIWTPGSTGLPVVFDCFRAQPSVVTYGFNNDREAGDGSAYAMSQVTINLQALPYVRSGEDGIEELSFSNGLVDGNAQKSAIQIDDLSTVQTMLPYTDWGHTYDNGGWRKNTAQIPGSGSLIGANSAEFQPPSPPWYPWPRAYYEVSSGLDLDFTGLYTFGFWLGQSFDTTQWAKDPKFVSNVTVNITLIDNNNKTLNFSTKYNKAKWGSNANKPVWTWIAANFPQNHYGFNYSHVAGYKITLSNWGNGQTTGFVKLKPWINGISAYPGTIAWADEPRSSVYSFKGKTGMARSPVSSEIQLPAQAAMTQEITKSGTWLVPTGVTEVLVEAFGGGGGGASVQLNTNVAAAGGGGGEYAAEPAVSVIPGTKVPVNIGEAGRGGQLTPTVEEYTAPGTHKWVCPEGVTSIYAEVWGGGAAGAAGGAGGGGGEYARNPALPVTPGKSYTWIVGDRGMPNSSTRAADRVSRDGGTSQVVGDATTVTAYGGTSPVTGGTGGGNGGNQSGAPVHHKGGNGGSSPGAAGGGGGAGGGPNGPGVDGGNSPASSANGRYKTGGKGGGGAGNPNSGNGGNGANAPGTAAGGYAPGGGGGGGYTGPEGKNYNGASGGYGKIQITYQVNLGNKVNGGDTSFGDVSNALTNYLVTAHGGTTPSANATTGAAGGTGSTNTTHYDGGAGGLTGVNNELMLRPVSPFENQSVATGTAATFVTPVATTARASGISVLLLETSAALDSTAAVTDTAGNVYTLVAQQSVGTSGPEQLYVFSSTIEHPIKTTHTVSLSVNATSVTYNAAWLTSQYFHTILTDNVAQNSGTGTTTSSPFTNGIAGAVIYEMAIAAVNSTATLTSNAGSYSVNPATTNAFANTNLKMAISGKIVPGSSVANSTMTTTLSASDRWAAMKIPFAAINQETAVIPVATGTSTSGTSVTVPLSTAFGIDANSGVVLVAVSSAGAGASTVTDNAAAGANTYTSWNTVASGGQHTLFYSVISKSLTTSNTITVTTPSGYATVDVMFVPNATGVDTASDAVNSGTSAAPSATSVAAAQPGGIAVAMFGNHSAGTYSAPTTGWSIASQASVASGMYNAVYFTKQPTTTAVSCSVTQSVSGAWGAVIGTVKIPVTSGAGGSSAGPDGVGIAGVGGAGGPAWSGGGKGADGVTGAGQDGGNAALPGGGGSGASASGATTQTGGYGGAGMVRLTWQPPLRTFNDLIIHRPAADSQAKFLNPVVDVGPYDPPDNREYSVASLVDGANAQFGGTYTVLLVNHAWASSTQSRRVTVTVNQYEYKNGPVVSAQATKTLTPDNDIVNGYVTMGELTLPIKDYDQSVSETYYTVSVHSTNQNDRFQDVIFLDTMGQTVLVNIAAGTAGDGRYSTYYIDEPDFDRALGKIMGSGHERDRAVSVMDQALATGGPLYVDAGDNDLMVYSTSGAPNLGVTYSPRWFTDRMS